MTDETSHQGACYCGAVTVSVRTAHGFGDLPLPFMPQVACSAHQCLEHLAGKRRRDRRPPW